MLLVQMAALFTLLGAPDGIPPLLALHAQEALEEGSPDRHLLDSGRLEQAAADTLRYSVLMQGNRAGSEVVWRDADGGYAMRYEYNDRGRGPDFHVGVVLGEADIPVEWSVTGVDYLKSEVE